MRERTPFTWREKSKPSSWPGLPSTGQQHAICHLRCGLACRPVHKDTATRLSRPTILRKGKDSAASPFRKSLWSTGLLDTNEKLSHGSLLNSRQLPAFRFLAIAKHLLDGRIEIKGHTDTCSVRVTLDSLVTDESRLCSSSSYPTARHTWPLLDLSSPRPTPAGLLCLSGAEVGTTSTCRSNCGPNRIVLTWAQEG